MGLNIFKTKRVFETASNNSSAPGGGTTVGTLGGTTNQVAKFTGPTSIGDSQIADDGTNVTIGGTGGTEKLTIVGNLLLSAITNVIKFGAYTIIKVSQGAGAVNIAFGNNTTLNDADNGGAIAIGESAVASSDGISIGLNSTTAVGTTDGIAIGRESSVSNSSIRGIAIGRQATVTASNAYAIGNYTNASQGDTIILGNNSSGPKPNIGIGTSTPHASALLDLVSTTRGFVPPKMTTAQRTAIASPTNGLIVYDITLEALYEFTTTWQKLANQTDLDTKIDKLIVTNRQTASYTLVLTDADKLVEMNVGSANNLTIPLNATVAYPVGTQILLSQYGAGQTTVVAAGGVTINSYNSQLDLAGQYAGATLIKIATNEWYLFGNTA